jgi:hypothetical protein
MLIGGNSSVGMIKKLSSRVVGCHSPGASRSAFGVWRSAFGARARARARARPRNWGGGMLQDGGLFCSPSIIQHSNITLDQNRGRGRERNAPARDDYFDVRRSQFHDERRRGLLL